MDNFVVYSKIFLSGLGGVVISMMGGYDSLLSLLVYLIVFDVVTGFVKYTINHSISSDKMYIGLLKKMLTFCVVALAVKLESVFNGIIPIREVVIMFYALNEFTSIMENIGEVLPIPDELKNFFEQLQNKKIERKDDK